MQQFLFQTENTEVFICSKFLLDGENRPEIKKSNHNMSDENQTHDRIMERLTGESFWYSILGGLWDFDYQLEFNQENQQRYLGQVSFTHKKITQERGFRITYSGFTDCKNPNNTIESTS